MAEQQKVAVVTGSALNIGRATALALARDGYRVMVTARSSADDCARTAALIAEAGGEAAVHLADISDAKQARGLIDAAVARFGRLDVLVNNASVRRQTKFSELTVEEWREILGDDAGRRVLLRPRRRAAHPCRGRRQHRQPRRHVRASRRERARACDHREGRHGGHDARAGEGTGADRHGELRRARHRSTRCAGSPPAATRDARACRTT